MNSNLVANVSNSMVIMANYIVNDFRTKGLAEPWRTLTKSSSISRAFPRIFVTQL